MSTYRNPVTPDVGDVDNQLEAIDSIANVFVQANKQKIAINNAKTKKIAEENAEIVKAAQIDTQTFYKGLRETQADRADYERFNQLTEAKTDLIAQIQQKNLGRESYSDVMAERNRIEDELNQLVQLAESEQIFASNYTEAFADTEKRFTEMNGATSANGNADHMLMANTFVGLTTGEGNSIEKSFEDGVAYYTISNPRLDGGSKKVEAAPFLAKVYGTVPDIDKQIKNSLNTLGWTNSSGSPTPEFRNLTKKEYELGIAQMKAASYQSTMMSDVTDVNALFIDIFGGENEFIAETERKPGKFPGQQVSVEDAKTFYSYKGKDGKDYGFSPYFDSKMPQFYTETIKPPRPRGGSGTKKKTQNIRPDLDKLRFIPTTKTFMDPYTKYADTLELADKIRDMGFVEVSPSSSRTLDDGTVEKFTFTRFKNEITGRETQIDDNDNLFMVQAKLRFAANDNFIQTKDKDGKLSKPYETTSLEKLYQDEIRRYLAETQEQMPPYIQEVTVIED